MSQNNTQKDTYLINDVSQRVALSQKRLREYEKEGLIKPDRDPNTNNRLYTEKDISNILRIKALIHEHGFTLSSLRYIVVNMACWDVFGCKEKTSCPVYESQLAPCYATAWKSTNERKRRECKKCPIYLNRNIQKMTLLEDF